jgi:rod shape-determining protein MreD
VIALRYQYRLAFVMLLLVILHFVLRPFLADSRGAPDFLLLALLVFAVRARPGDAAIAGFVVGLLADSLTPIAFGAGALAHTCVGYLAAWGKAVFFAENVLVSAGFFFLGTWLRDAIVLVAGRHMDQTALLWQLSVWSPVKALATALVGVVVLVVFRRWLHVRIGEQRYTSGTYRVRA